MTVHSLENASIQLVVNPELARWSLSSRGKQNPSLENVQIGLNYRRGLSGTHQLGHWNDYEVTETGEIDTPQGPLRQLSLAIGGDGDEIHCRLTFALPQDIPMLFWKIAAENQGDRPVFIDTHR